MKPCEGLKFHNVRLALQHAEPLHLSTASHFVFHSSAELSLALGRSFKAGPLLLLKRTGVSSKAVAYQHHPEKRHSVDPGGQGR